MTVVPAERSEMSAAAILAPQATERIAMGRIGIGRTSEAVWSDESGAIDQAARPAEPMRAGPAPGRTVDLIGLGSSAAGAPSALGLSAFRTAPRSSLLGAGGNARHVVYVLDRSGSMIDTFEEVRRAVLLSIGRLDSEQDFHVILFADGKAIENPPRRLVPPTEASRLQAADFLAAARSGYQSDPIPALSRAFDMLEEATGGGKLIYLLSDGVFPDGQAVLAVLANRNRDKEVRINTYFCGGDGSGKALLKEIARSTGGLFRQVGTEAVQGDGLAARTKE
jgi:hypothetical protein